MPSSDSRDALDVASSAGSETTEPRPPESPADAPAERSHERASRFARLATIFALLFGWTYLYNVVMKEQGPVRAFFLVLDTISDDFVVGAAVTIAAGVGIVLAFSVTKLYGQICANIHSFKILEDLVARDVPRGAWRELAAKIFVFRELPQPDRVCPDRVSAVLLSFAFIYAMSWVYVVLFSEALFFAAWSAGVDLPITHENMLFMPTLALAIPFSARVMAYLRYPDAQDYADFMPGAVFVYLLVTALGTLFGSETQNFFLERVWADPQLWIAYLRNGVFLAFIPVFFEASFWIAELLRVEPAATADSLEPAIETGVEPAPASDASPVDGSETKPIAS